MVLLIISFISIYNQPTWGIDNPLPTLLNHGEVVVRIKNEPANIMRGKIGVGIWNSILLGVSYGGSNIVGYGDIEWEERPYLDFRIKLLDTGFLLGTAGYNDEPIEGGRFESKEMFGILGVRSKMGPFRIIFTGGVNYNSDSESADFFSNAALNLNGPHTFHIEYILGAPDDDDDERNRFNLGYSILSGALSVQIDLKDLASDEIGRQIQIGYRQNF